MRAARHSIWARAKHRSGLEDPTFAHGSVATVNRGSLQPTRSLRYALRREGE